jgi:hypothetical protein
VIALLLAGSLAHALVAFECGTYRVPGKLFVFAGKESEPLLVLFENTLSEVSLPVRVEKPDLLPSKVGEYSAVYDIRVEDRGFKPKQVTVVATSSWDNPGNPGDLRQVKQLSKGACVSASSRPARPAGS